MSLRSRLIVAVVVVAVVAVGAVGVATYSAFTSSQLREVDTNLQRAHEPIEQAIESGGADLERAIEVVAPGLFVAVIGADGSTELTIPARSPGHDPLVVTVEDLPSPAAASSSGADRPTYATRSAAGSDVDVRLRTSRLADGTVLVIGTSLEEIAESATRLVTIEAIVAAIAVIAAVAVGWMLIHLGLRPLRAVEETARSITVSGELDLAVPGANERTEVGRLASAFDTMLARIRQAFAERDAKASELQASEQRMRQLVADVSHELRTPIAAVAAYAELFERGARNHPQDLDRALRGIGVESARMSALVEELLLLARLDEGVPLQRTIVDLNEVVVDAISAAAAVSADWPITLRAIDVVMVDGDGSRLRQVIDNLLANVRTHTPPGTATSVELRCVGDRGVLVVADDGPGMSADQAAHVFERFYRADASRSRASGGAGLGMAIVRALVVAHDGNIHVDTAPGAGLRVTIDLPRR